MSPREIVATAWAITVKEKQLRRWGFISAFLATLLNVKLLIYQVWFLISYLNGDPIGFFTIEAVLHDILPGWLFYTALVLFIILLVVEWLFPHMAKGAIIGLAAKSYKKEEVKGGLVLGVYNFFRIFASHELLVLSGIPTVITILSLILRYGGAAAPIAIILLLTAFVASVVLEFFWIFVEEAIVIRKAGLKTAFGTSFKLVISHLGHVVFLILLMFFIILRIVANLLMVILIPGIVMGVGFMLGQLMPAMLSYSIATVLGLGIVVAASYFFAYLEVFRQCVWTITYIELSRLKDLDVIEDSID